MSRKPKCKIVQCDVEDEDGVVTIFPTPLGEQYAVYVNGELAEIFRSRTEAEQAVRDYLE